MKRKRMVGWGILFALLVLCVPAEWGQDAPTLAPAPQTGAGLQNSLKQFSAVYKLVEQNYADPVSPDLLIYGPSDNSRLGAIPSMLNSLDPHSTFFDPTRYAALREEMEGDYYGVGMRIGQGPGKKMVTEVIYPLPDSPAFQAGLRPGDIITEVNGQSTLDMDSLRVADILKGPKGTVAHIAVLREGSKHPLDFTLTRQKITQLSVDSAFMIRPGIAYIHINTFNEVTDEQLTAALDRLGQDNFRGLVLDLRGNLGGLLNQAVAVASHFLRTNQLVVYHYGRSSSMRRYYVTQGEQGPQYPIIVLIDSNTASAAEIVTGALQDHDRALVMGQPSFGKGLVQTEFPLTDDTMLLLTTARYYTPSGRLIQRDYSHMSLYDYFNHYNPEPLPHSQARLTDGGRTVYGGTGITPDVTVPPVKWNTTQQKLGEPLDINSFFEFGPSYLASHKSVPADFEPDRKVLDEFKKFIASQNIPVSDQDFSSNVQFIRENIRAQLISVIYGQQAGQQITIENEPLVLKALDSFGEARALLFNARRYMARRGQQ